MILVVGDFVYDEPIHDPMNFTGAASKITNLAGHRKILALAREHDREVWFDVHIGTDGPGPSGSLKALPSFIDALAKVADGAKHKVVVFEYNAQNHAVRRALGNALATNTIERDGRLPIVTSANCLQPDRQNDNGWDQGLLFLNPSQVWLQPPGYVTQMLSRNYLPQVVKCEVTGEQAKLDVVAKRSEDGKTLVLQRREHRRSGSHRLSIHITGFVPEKAIRSCDDADRAAGRREHRRQARSRHSETDRMDAQDQGGENELHVLTLFLHGVAVRVSDPLGGRHHHQARQARGQAGAPLPRPSLSPTCGPRSRR